VHLVLQVGGRRRKGKGCQRKEDKKNIKKSASRSARERKIDDDDAFKIK